jgi:hypothetical protein
MIGIFIVFAGILLKLAGGTLPVLPGDIYIKRDNFTFYFPVVSSIILSVILSVIFALLRK